MVDLSQVNASKALNKVNREQESDRWKARQDDESKRRFEEQMQFSNKTNSQQQQEQIESNLRRDDALRHRHKQELRDFNKNKNSQTSNDNFLKKANKQEKNIQQLQQNKSNNQQQQASLRDTNNIKSQQQKTLQNKSQTTATIAKKTSLQQAQNNEKLTENSLQQFNKDRQSKENIASKQHINNESSANNAKLSGIQDTQAKQSYIEQTTHKEAIISDNKTNIKTANFLQQDKLNTAEKQQLHSDSLKRNDILESSNKNLTTQAKLQQSIIRDNSKSAVQIMRNAKKELNAKLQNDGASRDKTIFSHQNKDKLATAKLRKEMLNKSNVENKKTLSSSLQATQKQQNASLTNAEKTTTEDKLAKEFITQQDLHESSIERHNVSRQEVNKLEQQQTKDMLAFKSSGKTNIKQDIIKKHDDKVIESKKLNIESKPIPLPHGVNANSVISEALKNPATRVEIINHITELIRKSRPLEVKGAFNITMPGKFWEGTQIVVSIDNKNLSVRIDANSQTVNLLKQSQDQLSDALRTIDEKLNVLVNIKEA